MSAPLQTQQPLPDELDLLPVEHESEFNLAEYLAMVRRHWKLVAAACLVCTAAGFIHYAITPKAYMAAAIIQIERRTLAPALSSQAPWLESYFDAEYYPTEYKLLESRGLAERVVKRLDLLSDPAFNPHSGGRAAAAAVNADDDQAALGGLAERVRGGLGVEPIRNTQLVEITYRASSPAFAARAANGFADAFIDMGIEYRFTSAGKTSTVARCAYFSSSMVLIFWATSASVRPVTCRSARGGRLMVPSSETRCCGGSLSSGISKTRISSRSRAPMR